MESDTSEPETVPFLGIGRIAFSPPSDVPLVISSRNDVDDATYFTTYGSHRTREIPAHWPRHESYDRLRNPHPLRVSNDRGCRWTWREFQMIQTEERQLEAREIPFTPGEYYSQPYCPYLSFGLVFRALLVIIVSCVVAAIIACIPSIYTARYLLKMTYATPWAVIRKHPWFFTKTWIIGSLVTLGSSCLIIGAVAFKRWLKRRAILRVYERL